jgi:hypothetical protein
MIPRPAVRIREDDPETVANRSGGFVAQPMERRTIGVAAYREGPDGKVVRLVGPAGPFLAE